MSEAMSRTKAEAEWKRLVGGKGRTKKNGKLCLVGVLRPATEDDCDLRSEFFLCTGAGATWEDAIAEGRSVLNLNKEPTP